MFNVLLTPLRLILSHDFANKIGLRSIRDDRTDFVLHYVKGRLLDVGCGPNLLVKRHGNDSVGVDIYDFGGGATIIKDASNLPFPDNFFNTVAFVACFNHIPNRYDTLCEIRRILTEDGLIILTMISPFVGKLRHKMFWIDKTEENRLKNDKQEGEEEGLSQECLVSLFSEFGYRLKIKKKFLMGLNNLYIFEPE